MISNGLSRRHLLGLTAGAGVAAALAACGSSGPGDATARGDSAAEITAYLRAGIDGFFTDYPLIGVETLRSAKDHP